VTNFTFFNTIMDGQSTTNAPSLPVVGSSGSRKGSATVILHTGMVAKNWLFRNFTLRGGEGDPNAMVYFSNWRLADDLVQDITYDGVTIDTIRGPQASSTCGGFLYTNTGIKNLTFRNVRYGIQPSAASCTSGSTPSLASPCSNWGLILYFLCGCYKPTFDQPRQSQTC